MAHIWRESILHHLERLECFPLAFRRVVEVLGRPDASIRELARAVACDPALSFRLLRVANSSYYGVRGRVRRSLRPPRPGAAQALAAQPGDGPGGP